MENCKTVGVIFKGSEKVYTYKTTIDFEENDLAIVKANGGFKVVKIVEIHKIPQIDMDSGLSYEWIVQKIDDTQYEELNKLEAEFNDHLLELEQKALRANAMTMLVEKLGVKSNLIESAIKRLNGV